jgi:hypothetical protein
MIKLEKSLGDGILLTAQPITIELSGDWFSAIVNFLMLIVAVVSAFYAYCAYNHQKERSKKEAACNLAQYYASNIIHKYGDITSVFGAAGLTELIGNTFQLRDLQEFDKEELLRFLKDSGLEYESFEKKMTFIEPSHILNIRMSRACSPEDRKLIYNSYTDKDKKGNLQVINGQFLQVDFSQEISGLLNELEWFAMNCKYGLADEGLLYQSLHQTFLSTVWMLYFFISSRNENNADKLYTNVCWLFIKWRDRLTEIMDNTEAQKQAYIAKANAVKPKVYEGTGLK